MSTPQVFGVRRPLVLSGAPSNVVVVNSQVSTVDSLIGDQNSFDGLYYNLSLQPTHFRQAVPLRPPVPFVLGDDTNQEAIAGIVLVGRPIHAVLSMALPVVEVSIGDQTNLDGSVNIAVRGAPYRQPVPHSTVLNTTGDTTNQDAVLGIICDAQQYHQPAIVPPMSILGNQDNSEAIVVFPRSPESYFQATLRSPIVSVGHQDYADGVIDLPRVSQSKRQPVPLRSVSISVGDDLGLDGFGSILAVPINPPPPPPPTNYLPVISTIIGDQTYYDGTGLIVAFGATFQKVIKPVGLPTRIWRIIKRQTTR